MVNYYDEEVPFTYQKKVYPIEPFGDLRKAVITALEKIDSTEIEYKAEGEVQSDFAENVMKTVGENGWKGKVLKKLFGNRNC